MIYKQIIYPKSLNFVAGVTLAGVLSACSSNAPSPTTTVAANLSNKITVDGSSTVTPISKAVVKDFAKDNPGIKITVGSIGSGIGFREFCAGELDISGASRPIKKEESAKCAAKGIEFLELPIGIDGLTIAVNKENTWAKCLKTEEIKSMWVPEAEGKIINWNQIRADFPSEAILLFGAGAESGTFDYFTEAIVGKVKVIRKDYQPSEDDNVTVKAIQGGIGGLGFFGISYYEANADKINAVEVDNGKGCVAPTPKNIISGAYQPLSRPLFIYVNKQSLKRPEVKAFVDYYVDKGMSLLVRQAGYVPLPNDALPKVKAIVKAERTGSTFMGAVAGTPITELLEKDLK
ncbi:MAG: PstS family phosphate ABC transporter substrate-binding protein [Pseudanabaena sp. ELA607]|jgi:phosphate transport system substrate-binding protein